jgi:5-methylcytosine-specific restriction endonuclease McrA
MPDTSVISEPLPVRYKKRAIPNAVRREVCRRAGAEVGTTVRVRCAYCPAEGSIIWSEAYAYWPVIADLELDHVHPEYRGGPMTADNITLACRPCNRRKGARVL